MDRTRHPTFFLKAFDGTTLSDVVIEKVTGEVFELEDQMALLVRAVRDGARLSATGHDGRWAVAMCRAAAEAVDTGQPVTLDAEGRVVDAAAVA